MPQNSSTVTIATETSSLKGTINILLVDANQGNLASCENVLIKESRTFSKAASGTEAQKIALEQPVALMLIDMELQDMNCFELAQLLKSNTKTKDINIIFIGDMSHSEKHQLENFEDGAVDFIDKPVDAGILRAKVAVFEKVYLQMEGLKEKTDKLQSINKQLDEFVYIVSHDLKAPLRGIASLANFIEDDLGADPKPEILATLNMLKSRCTRMQSLIDGILHYSRMSNNFAATEQVDINDLLKNILDLLSPPPKVKVTIQENMPEVTGEKIKLHEIFQNLVSNAIKYNEKEDCTVNVTYTDHGDSYEFAVTDNGIGIKEEHKEKIFGIFQTLQPKDKIESTGIGLTIVKKLVEQTGGKIIVDSVPGEGSTFRFTIKK